jgi:Tol biopolymer transport system component
MNSVDRIDRFESELPVALRDVAGAGRSDYLTDVLGRTARTRQRPPWASLERWLPMDLVTPRAPVARIPWRSIGIVALLGLLLAALIAVYAGSQRRLPPPFGPAENGVIPYSYDGDILVVNPVTGQTETIVGGPEEDYAPTFSQDGTQIGFLRGVSAGVERIMVVDADGGEPHAIAAEPFRLTYAQWVPGRNELIVGHQLGGSERLEIFGASGKEPSRLLLENAGVDWAYFRPPDADEILFRGQIDGTWGLYTMRPDGTGITLLAASEFTARNPGQPPDQDINFPAYSPDGSKIYYNHWSEAEGIQAWVMNADGSDKHRFNTDGPAGWWEGEMVPSPDGKWVLMWRVPPEGQGPGGLTIYPADGSGDGMPIGPDIVGTAHWSWAPDSTKVLMNYNDSAEGGQVLIDPVTGEWNAAPWGANTEPDWQRLAP